MASTSPTTPARASSTPRRATASTISSIWMDFGRKLAALGIDTAIPYVVDDAGFYTDAAPGFEGARVLDDTGKKGDANNRVITALAERGMMVARGRLKHQYPHSWRSKKPVIFRNTPQWFVYMDRDIAGKAGDTLRHRALAAIDATKFYPAAGQNRLRSMIAERPDWVLSRQRAWGVPIAVFYNAETNDILKDETVNHRIGQAFEEEGRRRLVQAGRQGALPRQRRAGPATTGPRSTTSSMSGSRAARRMPGCCATSRNGRDLEFPAACISRARTSIAAGSIPRCSKAAPPTALRPTRRADARLHPRWRGQEDVEIARQHRRAAGHHQAVRRRYPAPLGRRRPTTRTTCASARRSSTPPSTAYRKLRNTLRWLLGNLAHYKPRRRWRSRTCPSSSG